MQVTITPDKDKVEPGHDVNIDITAAANSFVGILAIDQSVKLLKTGNDITQDQVSMGCGCVGWDVWGVWIKRARS